MPVPINHRYYKKRRRVRHEGTTPDDLSLHVTKSWSGAVDEDSEDVEYSPAVDAQNGKVFCDCDDFEKRCAQHKPRMFSPTHQLCKHLIRAILNDVKNGRVRLAERNVKELEAARHRTTLNPIILTKSAPATPEELQAMFDD